MAATRTVAAVGADDAVDHSHGLMTMVINFDLPPETLVIFTSNSEDQPMDQFRHASIHGAPPTHRILSRLPGCRRAQKCSGLEYQADISDIDGGPVPAARRQRHANRKPRADD